MRHKSLRSLKRVSIDVMMLWWYADAYALSKSIRWWRQASLIRSPSYTNKSCKEFKWLDNEYKQVTQVALGLKACMESIGKYPPHWSLVSSTCPRNSNRVLRNLIARIFLEGIISVRQLYRQPKTSRKSDLNECSFEYQPTLVETKAGHLTTF